jgi:predicted TIM-barrel fold metal-dependent hydrolase
MRFEEQENLQRTTTVEELRPGGWIPEEHMKDMDEDGVDVSIVYPTVGLLLYSMPDSDLLTEIFRIYNDWLAEFCKPFPDRLKGIACINVDDVQSGVRELERCANMGLAGGMITVYPPEGHGYNQAEYEPLWAAAQDLRTPLGLHIATNRPGPGQEFVSGADDLTPAFICNTDHWVRMSLSHMIFGGVFQRYPKLQVGSVEMELSWVPHFLDRMDYTYTQRTPRDEWWSNYKGDLLPSEYFHNNVFVGFQEDGLGIKMRDIIGVDCLMWGSDYPHVESTFPRSKQILEEILADCTEEEKAKIAGGNAARVYNLN